MTVKNITLRAVRALSLAAALTLAFAAEAQTVASDTLTRALATLWGTSVNLKSSHLNPEASSAFIDGVSAALTDTAEVSNAYSRGVSIGQNFLSGLKEMELFGLKVDREAFAKAVTAVLKGENVGFTGVSAGEYIDKQIAPLIGAHAGEAFTPEKQEAFVAEASRIEGAVTTPSGLVFQVIQEGEGDFPTEADRVELEYTGRLSDGSVFDETEEPVNFDLIHLVPGFSEGLKLMRPGGKYKIVFPAKLGYGDRGAGDVIPPGAAIEFTVRLLSVDRGAAAKQVK